MAADTSAPAQTADVARDDAPPSSGDPSHPERDPEVAVIFGEMRRATEKSVEELAAHLKTPVQTINALEAGAIKALPAWAETSRVVTEYAKLVNAELDPGPLLRRLQSKLAPASPPQSAGTPAPPAPPPALASAAQAQPAPATPPKPRPVPPDTQPAAGAPTPPGVMPPAPRPEPKPPAAPVDASMDAGLPPEPPQASLDPAPEPAREKRSGRRRFISVGTLTTWFLVLVLFGAMAMGVRYAVQHPKLVWSTVDSLPDPAPRVVRSVWELVRPLDDTTTGSIGPDPKSQKSDRLPSTPQNN